MKIVKIARISMALSLFFGGCQPRESCPSVEPVPEARCPVFAPQEDSHRYEIWDADNMHFDASGIYFDLGGQNGEKYLERSGATPWSDADFISHEVAEKEELPWAHDRFVRWLASDKATIHFPYDKDRATGDFQLEIGLRPKMNLSMSVRFYRSDGHGGRTWSDAITQELTPGWHGYRLRVPAEYLAEDGMQLMRIAFPATYFEGDRRVSAKFEHIAFGPLRAPMGRFELSPMPDRYRPRSARILSQTHEVLRLRAGDRLERFTVVPASASIHFISGPAHWLRKKAQLTVSAQTDEDATPQILAQIELNPGACWEAHEISLESLAGQAARFVFEVDRAEGAAALVQTQAFREDVWISPIEVRTSVDDDLEKARQEFENPKRIVILAIDNLRYDRLWNLEKRRATPNLSQIADSGLLGLIMGEGKFFNAMETSFLTSVPAAVHGVRAPGMHVRTALTTLAEAVSKRGWSSHFFSTSAIIDAAHGYAQGFSTVRQLNKDNIFASEAALREVSSSIAISPEKSLYYVHLSQLRLPHRGDDESFKSWSVAGYDGPVDEAAMHRVAVLRDPTPRDARQFEAYYDAELVEVDKAIGAFVKDLPPQTLVVIYGTHGTSLGESTLGYEQGLTPWELLTPFVVAMTQRTLGIRREEVASASDLSASILAIAGADAPTHAQSIFQNRPSIVRADEEGMTATASAHWFYRIRREGVDAIFNTGIDGATPTRIERGLRVTKQSLRERIY